MPRGHALNPTEEAVAWADSEAEQVPVEAWPVLGVPGASADTSLVSHLIPSHHLTMTALLSWYPSIPTRARLPT